MDRGRRIRRYSLIILALVGAAASFRYLTEWLPAAASAPDDGTRETLFGVAVLAALFAFGAAAVVWRHAWGAYLLVAVAALMSLPLAILALLALLIDGNETWLLAPAGCVAVIVLGLATAHDLRTGDTRPK